MVPTVEQYTTPADEISHPNPRGTRAPAPLFAQAAGCWRCRRLTLTSVMRLYSATLASSSSSIIVVVIIIATLVFLGAKSWSDLPFEIAAGFYYTTMPRAKPTYNAMFVNFEGTYMPCLQFLLFSLSWSGVTLEFPEKKTCTVLEEEEFVTVECRNFTGKLILSKGIIYKNVFSCYFLVWLLHS
jgi:hypothetical protein